ncbi:cytochrome c biogenesis CcdA family protein [Haliovirga abyssi]|uniref:Cytochrome C biogenesis protein CcdA n=1 Tax=Haliovirga abyssi TaxID=2996794 RepID=A0AAU9DXZ1_9FUSO|nr:cytochrome c biogenesis protein CcdA [Haliovirga abyssi]BDU50270.1 cytochrome C biogenesis protein CcdA [Haliovirga abyssi]
MDGMTNLSLLLVFGAGIASFFSPCTLPLIPVYLSYISGIGAKELNNKKRFKIFFHTLSFILGFTTIFVIIEIGAIYFANIFSKVISNDITYKIAGTLVIVLGIHMTGIFKIKQISQEKKLNIRINPGNYFSSYGLGLLFALGWSPCVGPILASVVMYASQSKTMSTGVFYLIIYSLGMGIPFLIFGFLLEYFMKFVDKINKYGKVVEIVSGLILILMGLVLFFNKLGAISSL